MIGGLAALRLPERRGDPTYRAFAAWIGGHASSRSSIYTADKAAYLSTNFGTLWEERNLIYLSPLLLIGTALVFEAQRIDRLLVAVAGLRVSSLVMVLFKPIQDRLRPTTRRPASRSRRPLHYYEHWSTARSGSALLGCSRSLLVLFFARRRRRGRRALDGLSSSPGCSRARSR